MMLLVLVQGADFENHYLKAMRERYFIKSMRPLSPRSYGFDPKFVLRDYYMLRKWGGAVRVCMCVRVRSHTLCLCNSVNKEGIIPKSIDSES